jgi:hypothetical protein
MIWFQYPEVLLLAVPVGLPTGGGGALAGPRLNLGGKGLDVIVVTDRSRSMSAAAQKNVVELIHELEHNRKSGDRVACRMRSRRRSTLSTSIGRPAF